MTQTLDALLVGDIWPMPLSPGSLLKHLGLEQQPDIFVATLDASMTGGASRENQTLLTFDEGDLESYRLGRENVWVTASNHITDFGDEGFAATKAALDKHGFQHVGAGENIREAARPLILTGAFGRVGILAYAEEHPRCGAIAADEANPGANPYRRDAALKSIRTLREEVDSVWVILHWGEEFVRYPDREQKSEARQMIEAGADLVVGGHTHVPMGYEDYLHGQIFYGLGNFVFRPFPHNQGYLFHWHPLARHGVALRGQFSNAKWRFEPFGVEVLPDGTPRRTSTVKCQNYGHNPLWTDDRYNALFPLLRKEQRAVHYAQRLLYMTNEERAFRLRKVWSRLSNSRSSHRG